MSNSISRRSFLKGSMAAALAATLPNMRAVAEEKTCTYADTIAWDGEYDVLVMGFGGAGAVAAHHAGKKGAKVLLFDAAPKGHEGGNTRYCMQCCACGDDKDALLRYYLDLSKGYDYDEEQLKVFTEELTKLPDLFINEYGANELYRLKGFAPTAWALPEYPEAVDSDSIDAFVVHFGFSDGALWNMVRTKAVENENVDVLYEARGRHLIQDPESKTILGVAIEKNGQLINIRAKNGVVMSCGGFENNLQMVQNYLLLHNANPTGTLYNRGDGVTMALEVNADLWHMASYESSMLCLDLGNGTRSERLGLSSGSFFTVGSNGQRFMDECNTSRHGRLSYYGSYQMPSYPATSYAILDEAAMQSLIAAGKLTENVKSVMTSAASFAELAETLGMNQLLTTVEVYNSYAASGNDREFFRDAAKMQPVTDGPCYAIRMVPSVLNTQGGARRNAKAEVIGTDGNPIPHLYSAGEFGGLTAHYYQGATNIAECVIFGKIAGENAAEEKAALETYTLRPAVESTLTYVPGCSEETAAEYATDENEYIGVGTGIGGDVVVKCKIEGGEITAVEVLAQTETEGIGTPAIEALPAKFVGCKSAEDVQAVDVLSGATITSKALKTAVIDCLTQSAAQ